MSKKDQTTEIKVRLNVTDFSCRPNEIGRILGLRSSKTWRAGEKIESTIRLHKQNGWRLDSGLTKGSIEQKVKFLISKIQPKLKAFKRLPPHAAIELSCIIYTRSDHRPAISFPREALKTLSEIGASIDIDLYILN